MRKPGLVGQADIDRHLVEIGQGQAVLAEILPDLQDVLLAQIGDDVDRVELGDLGERALLAAPADKVAGIDQMLADDAVERGADLGIAEVQLRQPDLRLRAQQLRLGAGPLEIPVVDLGLGRGVLLDQRRIADEFGLGVEERRLRGQHLGLRLLQLIFVLVLLNREKEIAFLDPGAVLVMLLFEIAFDPGDELDRIDRRGVAGHLDIVGDVLDLRYHHRDGGRGRRCLRRDRRGGRGRRYSRLGCERRGWSRRP